MPDAEPRLAAALADRYRLEREIGAGGMATVYLAHDLKHDRKVAVKVLRAELSAVIGADRFLAEIKTTAALQHPHILPLFDSGQAAGFLFYVMPLIEGESLRDRLKREHQLPVEDAVRLAKEIGSALDYAHRHGVIHRDIKPENVLLHDGAALVADFGIALAVSQAGGARMTETGLSLGTPGYMSPEQATGERGLDARSDVYSVGCLLYEMLAGEPPHTGPTIQAVIAAVVTKEPERLALRRRSVPANVEAAVHKALAKLPADRFPSADAFVRALSEPATSASLAAMSGFVPTAPAPASKRQMLLMGAGTLLLAGIAAWGWLRPKPKPFPNRYAMYLRTLETLSGSVLGGRLAITKDGRKIAYVGRGEGNTRIWIKEAGQINPTPLAGTEGGLSPFFSPDGSHLGFVKDGRTVRVIPLDGGSALTLVDSANATAAYWGGDGYVYFEVDSGISRIKSTGGPREPVFEFHSGNHVIGSEWPVVLPGNHGMLFRERRDGQAPADYEIMLQPLPKGQARALVHGVYATYSPTGHLVVVTFDGKLLAVPFDLGKMEVSGSPSALYDGLESNPFASAIGLSDAGTLIYQTASQSSARELVWVTRDGGVTQVDPAWKTDGTIINFSLSPNEHSIAVELQRGTKTDIWVKQLPGGPFSRITFGDTAFTRPTWAHDGSQIIYLSDRGDGGGLPNIRRADGVGAATRLLPGRTAFGQAFESGDGSWLVLRRVVTDPGNGDIYAVHHGDTTLVPLVTSQAAEMVPSLSPDGKWLAYASDESGTAEVYVRPFPNATAARWQVSTAGGTAPRWAHSGKELFFRSGKGELISVPVSTTPTFNVGQPKVLFSLSPFLMNPGVQTYSVSNDDKRFLMMRETVAGESGLMTVTENWFEELRNRTTPK
ncbi:MAG TPA: protein kinase [Gemmatimonadales bacterium]|nr:protein kinase [Gemmatimonadales bacterium]